MYNSAFFLIALIVFFIWLNIICDGIVWKYVDKLIFWIEDYYHKSIINTSFCFPKSEIPMYYPGKAKCSDHCETTANSSINPHSSITINCTGGGAIPDICTTAAKPHCNNPCNRDTELVFGCYKYVLDKLPGIITKFKVDTCGNAIESTKEIINHNLGVLTRIFLNAGNIYVEDSFSVEHIATVDSMTGTLTL